MRHLKLILTLLSIITGAYIVIKTLWGMIFLLAWNFSIPLPLFVMCICGLVFLVMQTDKLKLKLYHSITLANCIIFIISFFLVGNHYDSELKFTDFIPLISTSLILVMCMLKLAILTREG